MAKTITIPDGYKPLEIVINGCVYVYMPGETVSVPDEVASVIANMQDQKPEESSEVKQETISYDPVADAGKLLGVQDGAMGWSKAIPDKVKALEDSQYTTMDIQDIAAGVVEEKVPDAPESDGTYILTCTVSSGSATFTWESAEA